MVKLHIWDTSGQERFRAMTNLYYRDAQVAILTYDITNESSFNSIEFWIKELRYKVENENMILCLVGNKCDVNINERKIMTNKGKNYANENNINLEINELDSNGWSPLYKMINENNTDMVQLILEHASNNKIVLNLNEKGKDGWSPILDPMKGNNAKIVQLILDYAEKNNIILDINEKDDNGNYVLFKTIKADNEELIKSIDN